ncbi:PREDICTED: ral guanine nucleotide dissociation stimulator-like [Acropora digitifera]|uniref:ral guanine nucleotide dissociation stimulator-like n=1 Tax=Acropora digitifera TaxID=70779 RepID=UPI00077A9DE9|nr:PREDICTED: ral guanine nucleotide dissociation stimulator-like [Acropora digitifera]
MMPALDLAISPATHQRGFWKEERVEGAIYSVSLKKIRYHSNFAASSESETPISQLQWHTMRVRTIKAGSLEKLVENLAPEKESLEELDPGYLIAFLSTYRTFAKTTEVIDLLFDRYRSFLCNDFGEKAEVVEGVLRGVVTVFTVWMEQFPGDFDESPNYTCLNKMLNFVTSEMKACHGDELSRKIQHRLDKFQITPFEDQDLDFLTFNLPVASNLNHASETDISPVTEEFAIGSADMLSMEPFRCAEQLTAMDAVSTRSKLFFSFFLSVYWFVYLQECRDLKNFSSLKAILSGLQSAPIHRLKKSWSNVSKFMTKKPANLLHEIQNTDPDLKQLTDVIVKGANITDEEINNDKKRRSRCIELGIIQGTVPYLGTFLTDLMMLHTALPDLTEDGLINFEKRRKEFEIIAQIKLFQGAAKNYAITHDDEFRLWFDNIKTFSEGERFVGARFGLNE